jgi:hypothetical protein
MASKDSTPLFTRTFDFLTWLIPVTNNFPRGQRFVVTKRLLDAALDFQEIIVEANNCPPSARLERLHRADAELDKVRLYLRLTMQWGWLTQGQYRHASHKVAEMGRLLGGWQKQSRGRQSR